MRPLNPISTEVITSAATAVYGRTVYDKGDILSIQSTVTNSIMLCREYVAVPGFGSNSWESPLDCWATDAEGASAAVANSVITATNETVLDKTQADLAYPYVVEMQQDDADEELIVGIGRVVNAMNSRNFGAVHGRLFIPYGFSIASLSLTFSINYINDDALDPLTYEVQELTGGAIKYWTGSAWSGTSAPVDITGSATEAQFLDVVTLNSTEDATYQIRISPKAADAATDSYIASVGLHETIGAFNGFQAMAGAGPIIVRCDHRTRVGTGGNAGSVSVTRME